jgi:hypothetical protein
MGSIPKMWIVDRSIRSAASAVRINKHPYLIEDAPKGVNSSETICHIGMVELLVSLPFTDSLLKGYAQSRLRF